MLTKTRKWLLAVIALLCTAFIALGVGLALPWAKLFPTKTVQAETATTAVTFTNGGGSAQNNLSRYLINVTEDIETSGSLDVKVDVYKNGSFIGEKNVNLYDANNNGGRYVLVPYSTFVANATTYSEITDKYVIVLKANTVYGSYHVANEMAWYITGSTVNHLTDKGEVSLGATSGTSQDNYSPDNPAKRYLLYYSGTTAVSDAGITSYRMPMTISKAGAETTYGDFEHYPSDGLTILPYEKLTGDSTVATAEQITDTYTLTLKKGSIITNGSLFVTVSNSVVWTINKYTVSGVVCDIEITVTPSSTFSLRDSDYYTVISYDQELGIEGIGSCAVPVEVSKDGDSIGTKNATLWLNGDSYHKDNAGFIFGFTNKNIIDGFYTATLKKGTIFTVNGKNVYVKNEISWFMDPTDGTFWTVGNNYGKATLTSGAVTADDAAKKYSVTTTSDVDLSKIKAEVSLPMLVSKNGGAAETKNFTITNSGTTTTVAFDYATLLGDENATAASVTDTYTITLKKGTAVRSNANFALIANDVTWTIAPTASDIEATATPGNTNVDDNLNRYTSWCTTGVDWAAYGIKNPLLPFAVSKNGSEEYTVEFYLFSDGADFAAQQLILFEYGRLGSFTTAAENTDTYLITLKAGTEIKQGDVTVTFTDTVTWYARGKTFGVVEADLGEVTLTVDNSGAAQDGSDRYAIGMTWSEDLTAKGMVDPQIEMLVSKNNGTAEKKSFTVMNSTVHFTAPNGLMTFDYATLLGNANATAAENTDEYIVTLKKGSIIFQNGNLIRVANDDISWYIRGTTVGVIKGELGEVSFTVEGDSAAQDDYPRYMTEGTTNVDLATLGDGSIKDPLIPMTLTVNYGAPEIRYYECYNSADPYTGGKVVFLFSYANVGYSGSKAEDNSNISIVSLKKGTRFFNNGYLVTVGTDLVWYITEQIILGCEGDSDTFKTKTSFRLEYDNNMDVSEAKLRFGAFISVELYGKLQSLINNAKNEKVLGMQVVNSASITFGVEVSNGVTSKKVEWTTNATSDPDFYVAELTRVDKNGKEDANGDYYLFSAVVGGLKGRWDKDITARAYMHLNIDATISSYDRNKDYYFGATTYSVNSLAEKYIAEGMYPDSMTTLNQLAGRA